jgi:ABC-type transport system involved in multi-copper enzyme maturation permease subunit
MVETKRELRFHRAPARARQIPATVSLTAEEGDTALSPVVEIRLLLSRELRRSVRSAKGIALGALTLLGAFVTSLICVWVEGSNRARVGADSTQAFAVFKRQAIEKATGDASFATYAASIPSSLLAFLKITIWLAPLLVALLGFDAISGELQHRSVRFWSVRSRRWSYFTSKLLGLWLLVGIVTLLLNLLAGTVALVRGYVTFGELVVWGGRFWFVSFVIAGAWAAIATLISSCFQTPILALLTTFAVFFVLWLFGLSGFISRLRDASVTGVVKDMSWYEYLYPNAYDTLLLSSETTRVLTALGILIAFVGVTAAAGSMLFERRDI